MNSIRKFLLIPHIKIHNANAMSSPYTIGFPAMTAWLGAIHALQRHIQAQGLKDVTLTSVAMSCHQFNLQTYKGQGDFVNSIVGTSNPLDKDGNRPAFIEEARCHLEVSLLVEYQGLGIDHHDLFKEIINTQLNCMKIASGDVLSAKPVDIVTVNENEDFEVKKLLKRLMLGYVLIERRDLMIKSMQEEHKNALDALLDHLKVMHRAVLTEEQVQWTRSRKANGWLVPIAVGFQGISELAIAKHQRDSHTPHRFAECVVTLGEFVMPYQINGLNSMLWQYHADVENNLYLCQPLSTLLGD